MGKRKCDWQDWEYILKFYGKTFGTSRLRYRAFVQMGIAERRRPDLIGGGLVRSAGGWSAVKDIRRSEQRVKSDEWSLGDGNFVEKAAAVSKMPIIQWASAKYPFF